MPDPERPVRLRKKVLAQLNKLDVKSKQETHLAALALIPVKDRILLVVQINQ